MRRIFAGLGLALLVLLSVMLVRTFALRSDRADPGVSEPLPAVDVQIAARHLAEAIRFETISEHAGGARHEPAFLAFEGFLEATYPRVHAELARETVSAHSLLYTWKGSDETSPPLLLAAHHDVVPVEPGTEDLWEVPPFAGEIRDGVVWGRGALDDKGGVVAILEAVESLLAAEFVPSRTVYLAFGHDEEIGGHDGAVGMAARLSGRGVRLGMVVDEGGAVIDGLLDMVDRPVAAVGIAEKGSVTLRLSVRHEGGHSSTPPKHSGVGILAAAITRLENHQMPARLETTTRSFLEALGPELPFPARFALANLWITSGPLQAFSEDVPVLNAMFRTTTAATIFHGGVKGNVLPKQVEAVVNFRILPGDTIEDVVTHVRRTVDDERIEVEPSGASRPRNPSSVSPVDSNEYGALSRAIRATYPDAIVAPYLVVGGTDARHYGTLTDNVYRFGGFEMGPDALRLAHGTNERVEVEALGRAIGFYQQLIRERPDAP